MGGVEKDGKFRLLLRKVADDAVPTPNRREYWKKQWDMLFCLF